MESASAGAPVQARSLALVAAVVVVLVLNGVDAFVGIVPQGDDFTLSVMAPGAIRRWYVATYGWMARPLGIALMDAVNVVQQRTILGLSGTLLLVRAAALATLLLALWRQFELALGAAIVGVVLFALTPPAFEAWTQMTNVHNQLAAPLAVAACGLYLRALARDDGAIRARDVILAAAVQLAVYATYEQALLAIPAFVGVVLAAGVVRRRVGTRAALAVGAVAAGLAVLWGAALLASGYAAARGAALTQEGSGRVEARDAVIALQRLWLGTVQHHVWRAVELIRTRHLWWWDRGAAGQVAAGAAAAAVVAAVIGMRASRAFARSAARSNASPWPARPALLATAALVAAWAAMVPVGFSIAGFPLVSRMYYLPAAFLSLAAAGAVPAALRRAPRFTAAAVGAIVLWNAVVLRRYLEEARGSTRLAVAVARAVSEVPPEQAAQGILVVAQDVYGTWSTGAVQPWSLRPAARRAWQRDPAGALFFATTCGDAASVPPRVIDERSRAASSRAWGVVVRARGDSVFTAPTVAVACR